jgi:hypothetical protein
MNFARGSINTGIRIAYREALCIQRHLYFWGWCLFSCRQIRNAIKPAKPTSSIAKIKKETTSLIFIPPYHLLFLRIYK